MTAPLVTALERAVGKTLAELQRRDLVDLIETRGITILNLRYPSFDGKLRELRVPLRCRRDAERRLATGERVDGSSLFPGLFPPGASDVYAVPVYRWAFLDPWTPDELHVVCRFAAPDGRPCPETPDTVLAESVRRYRAATGLEIHGLAELEFYVILDRVDDRFSARAQRNYHQSAPYVHGRGVVDEILRTTVGVVGAVKYAHSEVGAIDRIGSEDPELDGRRVEQHELELDLLPLEDLATWISVSRWIVRAVADRHGASATFAPKLDEGMAGSGMHLHLALASDGRYLGRSGGDLAPELLDLVGGLLESAPLLAALGNTVAASYLRLVPGQEAPTDVGWGTRSRSSLVRVPLDFDTQHRLDLIGNPEEQELPPTDVARPTIELRSPDGSAFVHLLLAAIAVCAQHGAESSGRILARALRENPDSAGGRIQPLPTSAHEAAVRLDEARERLVASGFPERLVDLVKEKLDAEADATLSIRLRSLPASDRLRESRRVMHKDLHKH